jgi:hypothetical protein
VDGAIFAKRCEDKRHFTNYDSAERAMNSYIERMGAFPDAVHVYAHHDHFHWGHKPGFRSKGRHVPRRRYR